MQKLIFFSIIILYSTLAFSQTPKKEAEYSIEEMIQEGESPNWIKIKEKVKIKPEEVFTRYNKAFSIREDSPMKLVDYTDDPLASNMQHYLYQQYHQGIKIYGAQVAVHAVGDEVRTINGRMLKSDLMEKSLKSSKPRLSEKEALNIALAELNGGKLLPFYRDEYGQVTEKDQASFRPKGELVWAKQDEVTTFSAQNLVLCWKFDLWVDGGESKCLFINSSTGTLFKEIPLSINCTRHGQCKHEQQEKTNHSISAFLTPLSNDCDLAEGNATWLGKRTFSTQKSGEWYRLRSECPNEPVLHVKNMKNSSSTDGSDDYRDGDNKWTSQSQKSAIQAMVSLNLTASYYRNVHFRDGWDNKRGSLTLYNNGIPIVNGEEAPVNAVWNGRQIIIGRGKDPDTGEDDLNTLDVIGHEFTHGVVQASAGLEPSGESAALNESFADIFGEVIQRYYQNVEPSNWWLLAEDNFAIRSMKNPKSFGDPDTYKGKNWVSTGGAHSNNGVQNYAFYLLCVGGNGVNDNNDDYSVKGIGILKAEKIAYRALTIYLKGMPHATFPDSREAFIRAAEDLYGSCSDEAIQTAKAWYAVGVGRNLAEYNPKICGDQNDGFHQAINVLTAGGNCTTKINAQEENVNFAAGNYVVLKPGFQANAQGKHSFNSYIRACSFTMVDDDKVSQLNPESNPTSGAMEHSSDAGEQSQNEVPKNVLSISPNPFQSVAQITYLLTQETSIQIDLFSTDGKMVKNLVALSKQEPGTYNIQIDGSQLLPGLYICRMRAGDTINNQRLVLAK